MDARIAVVAAEQFGPVALDQLRACGLGGAAARARAAAGRLHRIYRGVYLPGHPILPEKGYWSGAVLACGEEAALSHLSGAAARGYRPDRRAVIDVSVGTRHGRRHRRIVCHSAARLRPIDVELVDGLPTTALARTLLDCAAVLGPRQLARLCQETERRRAFDLRGIEELLDHVPGHAGCARLRTAIESVAGTRGMTDSRFEDQLLAELRSLGLDPECNSWLLRPDGRWARADFLFRKVGLIVEADPRGTHNNVQAYRGDRRRDRSLRRIGFETMRFSDEDLLDPAVCARETRDRLDQLTAELRR